MKVLFICSGNSYGGISAVVRNQGSSLKKAGVAVEYFAIRGKGLSGYIKNISQLRRYCRVNDFDLYHAHYSLSGFVAAATLILEHKKPRKKLIVSLMGSDVYNSSVIRLAERMFSRFCWARVIIKSKAMKNLLGVSSAVIIPNGVDMQRYKPSDRDQARKVIGFETYNRLIVFLADPMRREKNFGLASEAVGLLRDINAELRVVNEVNNEDIPEYLNAADLLLSTSLWEGSANAIKEAMACNIPVVSTAVGDAPELFEGTTGYFLCSFDPEDVAAKIRLALNNGKTNGRDKLMSIKLDSQSVAGRIIEEYNLIKG